MVGGGKGRGVCGRYSTHLLKWYSMSLSAQEVAGEQRPIHCRFEGHPDIQVRIKGPSKQEGGDLEPVLQRKGTNSFLVTFTRTMGHTPFLRAQWGTTRTHLKHSTQVLLRGCLFCVLITRALAMCEPSRNLFYGAGHGIWDRR